MMLSDTILEHSIQMIIRRNLNELLFFLKQNSLHIPFAYPLVFLLVQVLMQSARQIVENKILIETCGRNSKTIKAFHYK